MGAINLAMVVVAGWLLGWFLLGPLAWNLTQTDFKEHIGPFRIGMGLLGLVLLVASVLVR